MFALVSFLLTFLVLAQALSISSRCSETIIKVKISAENTRLNLSPPKNQSELTGLITRFTSQTSNVTTTIKGGNFQLDASYDIWTQLCVPSGFSPGGLVEFAIHGINFDHSYWDFGGSGSPYNYVEAALYAGHAILIYDRLGVGMSSRPDGIQAVQLATEVEIAAGLVRYLQGKTHGFEFGGIIGVGHSFGSLQLLSLASKYGDLLSGLVLTGFSSYSGGQITSFASLGLTIASEQNPKRFGSLDSSYLATEGKYNDQMNFFRFPAYEPSALELASNTKGTLTIGELFTQTLVLAPQYTKPVFVVTGDKDFIFCGGDCYQTPDGSNNLIELTRALFPATSDYSSYIPPETGHAVNLHYSAPRSFSIIQEWIAKRS